MSTGIALAGGGALLKGLDRHIAEQLKVNVTVAEDPLAAVVEGVVSAQPQIDPAIQSVLAQSWKLTRLDATLRAILRAAAFELLERADVPAPVVVSTYTDITASFFDGPEAGFVNAALDRLAKRGDGG